ncbi:hypothetical protein ACPV3A_24095 [Paenibacillus sp. Dod16]|uniref:hypothetical protein n=1 Tax=Paenibacillus sp. Dod16 TaxID=3416392 RepID=UPI003CEB57A8
MAFDKQVPTWSAPGVEPPESKKQEGWQVNDKPPAAWLNWFMTLSSESIKELQEKAAEKIDIGGYGVTSNNGNAYAVTLNPAPTEPLPAGYRITIKINAASTGAPTLNINNIGAKPVLKANGSAASFKANGVYTLVYDGTSFFLQGGEGGEVGTATAPDVLQGKTFPGEDGLIVGTMPHLTGIRNATGTAKWGDGALAVYPEKGYQKGGVGDGEIKVSPAQLQAAEGALSPGNLPKDVSIFGFLGVLERMTTAEKQAIANAITGKGVAASVNDTNTVLANKIGQIRISPRKASGQTNASNSLYGITFTNGNTGTVYAVTVNGLDFTPRVIIISDGGYRVLGYYSVDIGAFTQKIRRMSDDITETLDYFISGNLYVNSSGFRLPAGPFSYTAGMSFNWYAYE